MGSSAVKRIVVALCLCLVGAFVSGLLLMQHHGEGTALAAVEAVCGGDGQTSGCDEVARSSWSTFAGFPVAGYGLVFYLALAAALVLALLGPAALRDTLAAAALAALALGLLVDLALLAVQVFAIHAYCRLCILTYFLSAGAAFALLPSRRALRSVAGALRLPEAQLALGGWALSIVAIAAAACAWDVALAGRAAQRQAHMLGGPLPPAASLPPAAASAPPATGAPAAPLPGAAASTTPAAPASAPGVQDGAYWQQRAQQLQATLDDPQKLEAYFTQKAQREYEEAQPVAIDVDGVPARGPAGAPVKVVEYSDFLCPFCRNLGMALSQFVPQAGGRVVVYFKNYPLDAACNPKLQHSTHPGACNVALGGLCAQRQGRFDAYHDKVFTTELHDPQPADVVRIATEAGLDGGAMQTCLADPKTRETLSAQIAEGNRLGVAATPTLYVNGKKLPRINDFVATVDKEARKKGFVPLPMR